MSKIDLKKQYKFFFSAKPDKPVIVDVPEFKYLMIDGHGNPNTTPLFKTAVEKLYSLSYTIKFLVKKSYPEKDYTVAPLSGLWWCSAMTEFSIENKSEWLWTLMIMQPDFVDLKLFTEGLQNAEAKKKISFDEVRFEVYSEGMSAQILHLGPFSEEKPTIDRLHNFIEDSGYEKHLKHHEIYLSDPRKTEPEKFKTIIRQPVKK